MDEQTPSIIEETPKKEKLLSRVWQKIEPIFKPVYSRGKVIASVMGILLLTVSLGIGIYLTQKRVSTKTRASGVALTLSTSNSAPQTGDTFVVAVSIDTQGQSVSAADVRVAYDQNLLTAESVQAGTFLQTVLLQPTVSQGLASIVVGCLVDQNGAYPQTGTGVLAQITFKATAPGSTSISFNSETAVAAIGQDTNVVETTTPVQINISGETIPAESPSPSPSPEGGSTPGAKPGDVNSDGAVNLLDIGEIINFYGKTADQNPRADINSDGSINLLDLGIVINNYGQ